VTHSAILRAKMEITGSVLRQAFGRLWDRPDLREVYTVFLQHLHYIMRASVPLMESALQRARELAASDPVAAGLASYLATHIPEETDHDEWTLDDLEVLGMSREAVLAAIPPTTVAAMVGAQYYWIHHDHPVAILGYIAVLEGNPPSPSHIRFLKTATGFLDDAFRTYQKHGQLDVYHREELARALDALPLSPRLEALISISAAQTSALFSDAIDDFLVARPVGSGGELRRVSQA
jgi:hypothetical protein